MSISHVKTMLKTLTVAFAAVWVLVPAGTLFAQTYGSDSSIEVTAPVGGSTVYIGDTLTTTFIVHNNAEPGGGLVVGISIDSGLSWCMIITETLKVGDTKYYKDSIGTYKWLIPDSVMLYVGFYLQLKNASCKIMVGAPYDEVFAADFSAGYFTIKKKTSSVKLPLQQSLSSRELSVDLNADNAEVFTIDGRKVFGPKSLTRSIGSPASGIRVIRLHNNADESATRIGKF